MCIGLPRWLSGKESACQAGDAGWIPGLERFPWRRKWQPILVFFLPWKPHGQRSLAGYSPWGHQRVGHDLVTKRQQQIHVCECRKNTPVSAGRLCDGCGYVVYSVSRVLFAAHLCVHWALHKKCVVWFLASRDLQSRKDSFVCVWIGGICNVVKEKWPGIRGGIRDEVYLDLGMEDEKGWEYWSVSQWASM